MFSILMTGFTALLFVVLTPGILVTIPPKGSKFVVALTHGVLFAILYHLTHKAVWHLTKKVETFENPSPPLKIKNGDMCEAQTCMCNGAEIAEKGRCE